MHQCCFYSLFGLFKFGLSVGLWALALNSVHEASCWKALTLKQRAPKRHFTMSNGIYFYLQVERFKFNSHKYRVQNFNYVRLFMSLTLIQSRGPKISTSRIEKECAKVTSKIEGSKDD